MALIKTKQFTQDQIDLLPISEGQFLVATDTGAMSLDIDSETRIQCGTPSLKKEWEDVEVINPGDMEVGELAVKKFDDCIYLRLCGTIAASSAQYDIEVPSESIIDARTTLKPSLAHYIDWAGNYAAAVVSIESQSGRPSRQFVRINSLDGLTLGGRTLFDFCIVIPKPPRDLMR